MTINYLGTFLMPEAVFEHLTDWNDKIDGTTAFIADQWRDKLAGFNHQFVAVGEYTSDVVNAFGVPKPCLEVEVYAYPTNIDKVKGYLMDFHKAHDLLKRCAAKVAKTPAEQMSNPLISGEQWKAIAASYPTQAINAAQVEEWMRFGHPLNQVFAVISLQDNWEK